MRLHRFCLLFLTLVLVYFIPSIFAAGETDCTCTCTSSSTCTTALNCFLSGGSPQRCTTVLLTQSVSVASGNFISNPVNWTNKTFNCQGYTITGPGATGYGFYTSGKINNTIINCNIKSFSIGIYIDGTSTRTNVTNVNLTSNVNGMYFSSTSGVNVTNARISASTTTGIEFLTVTGVDISNSTINGTGSSGWGLYTSIAAGAVKLVNNIINNTNNANLPTSTLTLNTTKSTGPNIYGTPFLGGNYWGTPSGTGYSDTCTDLDKDGLCNSGLAINDSGTDSLPLSKYYCYCNNSANSCLNSLNNPICTLTYLTRSGNTTTAAFVNSPTNFSNAIFDCQGYSIFANGTGTYGILLNNASGSQNSTIRNCQFYNFTNAGILIANFSQNITIVNVTINGSSSGIFLYNTTNNVVVNSTIQRSNITGINITGSSNNRFFNNIYNNTNLPLFANISFSNNTTNTGPNSGSTFRNGSPFGIVNWSNPGNAAASDTSLATASLTAANKNTSYLNATGFGFSVPSNALILGITVEIQKNRTSGTVMMTDQGVYLVRNGTVVGSNLRNTSNWTVAQAYSTYGSGSNLWGATWGVADINSASFGVAIRGNASGTVTANINHIRISVNYTVANPGQNSTGNTWNTTEITLTNKLGGPNLGGNYWAKPAGAGYSESDGTCKDLDRDGLCDSAYAFDSSNTDSLPLASYNCYCTLTANECKNAIASPRCTMVYLTQNGTVSSSFISGATNWSGKTFDCLGNSVSGNGTSQYGIYETVATNLANATVRNCRFTDFTSGTPSAAIGTLVSAAYNMTFVNLTLVSNSDGIRFGASITNSKFNNINSTLNSGRGLYLYSGSGTTTHNIQVENSTFSSNGLSGVEFANNVNFTNVTASYNGQKGFSGASSNYFTGVNASFNGQDGINVYATNVFVSVNASNNNQSGITVTHAGNVFSSVILQENLLYDLWLSHLNQSTTTTNITGSGGRQIRFYNSTTTIGNLTLSQLIIAYFNKTTITNITINGSSSLNNNGFFIHNSGNLTINKSASNYNYYGFYVSTSDKINLTDNIASGNNLTGFYVYNSLKTTLTRVNATNNVGSGIFSSVSTNTTVRYANLSGNRNGLRVEHTIPGGGGGGEG